MAKVLVPYTDYFAQTMQRVSDEGLLLVTVGTDGKPNVMTVGWGMIGEVWYRPIFLVLVRPSRHSYSRMEQVSDFTVNVLPRELAAAASLCGSVSGRNHDKFQEAKLTPIPSREVRSPIVKECVVHYECRTVHRVDMAPTALVQSIHQQFYQDGNFHRIYFGEIVASYAEEDAAQRLSAQGQGRPSPQP
ncbi:MAG: flavin reductase family protein [Candidatus Korobacteraceae bacterium]|jgi:flavin reductase (DIM6/NTAB) family NADH-FMN oxidoreductase RutF